MTAVTGLFLRQEDALKAVNRLPLLGVEGDDVSILRTQREVREHLDCSQRRPVGKYAAIGALIALAIFGFFAMLDCRTAIGLGIDPDLAVAETTAFALGGTLVGAFMGSLLGRDKAERETHLYLEGVRCGYLLLMVQAPENGVTQTLNILAQQGGQGVMICTRARTGLPASHGQAPPASASAVAVHEESRPSGASGYPTQQSGAASRPGS